LNADVDLGKLYFALDYGSWGRKYDIYDHGNSTDGTYENKGTYWRAGVDLNLLKKDPDRNMFFFGFRYGHATFDESATLISWTPILEPFRRILLIKVVLASWGEITTGLRVKVWKEFWMGYTARMKFSPGVKGSTDMQTYDIPGFGVNGNAFYWGFNYQIFWRIPVVKQKKPKSP